MTNRKNRVVVMGTVLACAALPVWSAPQAAASPPSRDALRFDDATGRDLRNFPRHPMVDYRHMKLDILVPDMNVPRMEIVQELTFAPIAGEVDAIRLDAKLLTIHGVACEGRTVTHTHDGQKLAVMFDPPVPAGQACTITTTYSVVKPPTGVAWAPQSAAIPGRAAQMYTKGAPEYNSYWFPCHDYPNERLTTELFVTVPAAFDVVANGRLTGITNKVLTTREMGGSEGGASRLGLYRRFGWLQDTPHPAYLVAMAIGRWDVIDVGTKALPMPVYAPKGRLGDVARTFGKTRAMAEFFAELLDEPYPWDQYAQVVVWDFIAGGMENTSATFLVDSAIYSADAAAEAQPESLVCHELAHQWFGDLITCNSWEHIWLNEGWATYCEPLWFEHTGGPAAYQSEMIRKFDGAMSRDSADAPAVPAMVSPEYRYPSEVFIKAANPYSKGASILHMLRRRLGDEAFFQGVRLYIDRFKFKQPETADFQQALEEASGDSLDEFIHQWCQRPGYPALDIKAQWDSASRTLAITAIQTQNIDGPNPAYVFDLPVVVQLPGGARHPASLAMRGREAALSIELPAEPRSVVFDPDMTVLAKYTIDAPASWLLDQARTGATLAARVQGIRALAGSKSPELAHSLEILAVTASEPELVRIECIKAIAKIGAVGELETLVLARPAAPLVREAAVAALAEAAAASQGETADRGRERAADMLARLYEADPSVKVRAACIRGLGKLRAVGHLPLIISAANVESHADRIRQAALAVIGELNASEGLALVVSYAGEPAQHRTRVVAIEALVPLAGHDPELVLETLAEIVATGPERPRKAARQALANLGDERGIAILEDAADATSDTLEKQLITDRLVELRAKVAAKAGK